VTDSTIGRGVSDPPYVRCDTCRATWVGSENELCWWCLRREQYAVEIQKSIDQSRLRDLLIDIRDGSEDAVKAAAQLLRVAVTRGTLARRDVWRFQQAVAAAEAE
jgi:hypothetical protein